MWRSTNPGRSQAPARSTTGASTAGRVFCTDTTTPAATCTDASFRTPPGVTTRPPARSWTGASLPVGTINLVLIGVGSPASPDLPLAAVVLLGGRVVERRDLAGEQVPERGVPIHAVGEVRFEQDEVLVEGHELFLEQRAAG